MKLLRGEVLDWAIQNVESTPDPNDNQTIADQLVPLLLGGDEDVKFAMGILENNKFHQLNIILRMSNKLLNSDKWALNTSLNSDKWALNTTLKQGNKNYQLMLPGGEYFLERIK